MSQRVEKSQDTIWNPVFYPLIIRIEDWSIYSKILINPFIAALRKKSDIVSCR